MSQKNPELKRRLKKIEKNKRDPLWNILDEKPITFKYTEKYFVII